MKVGMRLNDGMRDFLSPQRGHQGRAQPLAHTDHLLGPQRKGGEERHLRQQGRCGESQF